MYRLIEKDLAEWAKSPIRKPLMLHGARQVGKTFTARKFGKASFTHFVEINFEESPHLRKVFDQGLDLTATRVIRDLSIALQQEIIPGKTLLFMDEIQKVPQAIIALRYLYEQMPDLHVIAAGSLLNFAIEQVGVPVGRLGFLYLHPMSWLEFLIAIEQSKIVAEILTHDINTPEGEFIHNELLELLKTYLAIGGMPEVVKCWKETKDPRLCQQIHQEILNSYRQDFHKYARDSQIKYVEIVFDRAIMQIGKKFQFHNLETEYRKRELEPALELLEKACVINKVWHSSGHGIPLGSQASLDKYKIIFLDVGLGQSLLRLDLADWFSHGAPGFVNKGSIIEAFVGQELLAYSEPQQQAKLYYWLREAEEDAKNSSAEIDYLIQKNAQVVPIEVKSGTGRSLRSMRLFLDSHEQSKYGIRYSMNNYSIHDGIYSYPLYAIPLSLDYKY